MTSRATSTSSVQKQREEQARRRRSLACSGCNFFVGFYLTTKADSGDPLLQINCYLHENGARAHGGEGERIQNRADDSGRRGERDDRPGGALRDHTRAEREKPLVSPVFTLL